MRLIRCDRCRKEIDPVLVDKIGYVALNWRDLQTDDLEDGNPYEHCDFCPDCMAEIKNFIERTHPAAAEQAPDPEPEPVKPAPAADKKKPGRKPIDKGKIGALWDGNWKIEAIAEEMNLSTAQVWKVLHELRKISKTEAEEE